MSDNGHAAGLQYIIDHDQLTGLLNRHALERDLGERLGETGANPGGALVAFGIDNFRYLNASRGRETCDLLLTSVASVLASSAPDARVLARIGGDSFALFLADADRQGAESVAQDVLAAVRTVDLDLNRAGIRATISAGVTLLDREGLTPGDLLLEADLAMSLAKSAGRDRVAVYSRAEHRPLKAELAWSEQIREALESSTLQIHCQPVTSLRDGADHWELLVRLPRQDGGQLLAPEAFLPTAERFGLVEQVDAWVLERAVELLERSLPSGRRLELELNVSARSLVDPRFSDLVAERLRASGIDPGDLIFEVNEIAVVENLEEVRLFVNRLKSLGCRFALDNFGAKHASLAHLKLLPVDFVKIDGSFIRHLTEDDGGRMIVRAVIDLAHGFGQQAIAMHVGDEDTLELLRGYGADYAQGFHIGRPRPIAELELP
jgi:diguanylate cyclase (GGDEF)-like protein